MNKLINHNFNDNIYKSGKILKSFSRRRGKKLSVSAKNLLENELENFQINHEKLNELKNQNSLIWLEIGFGMGENLIYLAKQNPHIIFIGAEPYLNGVANILKNIKSENIKNIFLWPDDIRLLTENFNFEIFERIYILFPDPWPKKSHNKRRLISKDNIQRFIQKLKLNGKLFISTDHKDYADWALIEIEEINELKLISKEKPENWTETRYQNKALAGDIIYFFTYQKICN